MSVTAKKSVGRKRLMALATFLDAKAPEIKGKFSMSTWGKNGRKPTSEPKEFVAGHCGTTACALGWGTAVPMLRKAGLRAFVPPHGRTATMALVDRKGDVTKTSGQSGHSIYPITQQLFGIADEHALNMFMPLDCNDNVLRLSAKRAAARIRNTVAQIDKEEGWQF